MATPLRAQRAVLSEPLEDCPRCGTTDVNCPLGSDEGPCPYDEPMDDNDD